jgi:hypothetical protein
MGSFSDDLSRDLQRFLDYAYSVSDFHIDAIAWGLDMQNLSHSTLRPILRDSKEFFQDYKESGFMGTMFQDESDARNFLKNQLKKAEEICQELFE